MDLESVAHKHRILALLPELFRPIIQHLSKDRKALCAISLVCRILQYEDQRQLYRKMTFSPGTSAPGSHIKFPKSILDNKRLALLVHEYGQTNLVLHRTSTLWDYLCRGLQAMVNLKRLKFRTLDDRPTAEILKNCDDEDHLLRFLLSQQSLRRLVVDWAEDKRDLI